MATVLVLALIPSTIVTAVNVTPPECTSSGGPSNNSICQAYNNDDLIKLIRRIVEVMLFLIGAIAVIVIIIGGIRYVTSGGDPQQTKAAKDTILYAIIGIMVALFSYAIVQFVANNFQV